MRSTGEVMGIDDSFPMAFAKSQLAASSALPLKGKVFLSVSDRDKSDIAYIAKKLHKLGYQLIATRGTALVIKKQTYLLKKFQNCRKVDQTLLT